jgi:hypothetical protein
LLDFGGGRSRYGFGRHFLVLETLGQEGPTGEVVGDHVYVGIGFQVELGGGHFAAVTGYAVFADKGLYGLFELLVNGRGRGSIRHGRCGEGEGEEKGPKLH